MDVVVTGSRELFYAAEFYRLGKPYAEAEHKAKLAVWEVLDDLQAELKAEGQRIDRIIHGGAKGPDRYAASWAEAHDTPTLCYKPNWERYGKAAGFKRNWSMLFRTGGQAVSRQADRRTVCLKALERLVKQTSADKTMQRLCPTLLHDIVARREVLLDQTHPERRCVMQQMRIPVPNHALVVAFWDGRSKGTQQCIKAAHALGFVYSVWKWERAALPERPQDKVREAARIDHRTDEGGAPSFGTFVEKGCGRW